MRGEVKKVSTLKKDYSEADKEFKGYTGWSMKKTVVVICVVLFVVLPILGFLGKIIFFPARTAQKGVESAYEITDKTLDADNVIYNYEWFKQQYEDIQATRRKRENAKQAILSFKKTAGPRKNWTFEDKNEYARLNSVHLGLNNHLENLIATYNARSKMATRSIFKEGLIPETMEFTADVIK